MLFIHQGGKKKEVLSFASTRDDVNVGLARHLSTVGRVSQLLRQALAGVGVQSSFHLCANGQSVSFISVH
jgi:hypothetical protein